MAGVAAHPNLSRRHSDLPRLSQSSEIRNVKDLRSSPRLLRREKSHKSFDVAEDPPITSPSFKCLREEWELVSNSRHHKAVERHRMKREEDIVSRHTTFFPKKLTEEEIKYEKNCNPPLNSNIKGCYNTTSFPRGIVSIINVEAFTATADRERRLGTDYDADEVTSVFLNLGFIVQRYDNFTKKEILMVVEKDAREKYSDLSCYGCVVLSCGNGNDVYAIDRSFPLHAITNIFTNSNLMGIPKMIFLNTPKENDFNDQGHVEEHDDKDFPSAVHEDDGIVENFSLPSVEDVLYASSSIADFYSWRSNTRGSWFIQSICNVFSTHAHDMEVTQMMTCVNKRVRRKVDKALLGREGGAKNRFRTSMFVSKLTEDLFLSPPYGPLLLKKIPIKWLGNE